MNTSEFIPTLNDFYFQNLPANFRNGEYHAYLVGRNLTSHLCVCVW